MAEVIQVRSVNPPTKPRVVMDAAWEALSTQARDLYVQRSAKDFAHSCCFLVVACDSDHLETSIFFWFD
jgi:hypothetical protein